MNRGNDWRLIKSGPVAPGVPVVTNGPWLPGTQGLTSVPIAPRALAVAGDLWPPGAPGVANDPIAHKVTGFANGSWPPGHWGSPVAPWPPGRRGLPGPCDKWPRGLQGHRGRQWPHSPQGHQGRQWPMAPVALGVTRGPVVQGVTSVHVAPRTSAGHQGHIIYHLLIPCNSLPHLDSISKSSNAPPPLQISNKAYRCPCNFFCQNFVDLSIIDLQ